MDESHGTFPRPFLTIIAWPEGASREDVARLLAGATALDAPTLRLRLGREPPFIFGQVAPIDARSAVEILRQHGGDAFAPTLADLAALGPTRKIRDLHLEAGVLVVDQWRGGTTRIERTDVQVLVRAHLSQTNIVRDDSALRRHGLLRSSTAGYMIGGVEGMALTVGAAHLANAGTHVQREIRTSDKLDLHTTDGRVFQFDGDKFGFRILGDLRGHGDRANMDRLCELLAHVSPDGIVDEYYSLWRPPAGHDRLRLPDMAFNKDDPAFAFYSRWSALMYRHILDSTSTRPSG